MRVAIERLLALRGWSLTLLCGAVLAAAICLAFSLAAVSVSPPADVPLQAQWRRILPLRATLQQRVVHSCCSVAFFAAGAACRRRRLTGLATEGARWRNACCG